jgi:hypothetical protein
MDFPKASFEYCAFILFYKKYVVLIKPQMNPQRSANKSSISRKKNNKIPSALKHCVRDFWVRYLKQDLKLHPQICVSETYKDLAKLKDVSIKKLKNLVFTHVESQQRFEMVQQIYQEILEIFKRNPNIEVEYPKHTSLLKRWFQRILRLSYGEIKKLVLQHNRHELLQKFEDEENDGPLISSPEEEEEEDSGVIPKIEETSSSSHSPLNNTTSLVIQIPYEYLLVMQNQISHLIAIINSMSTR